MTNFVAPLFSWTEKRTAVILTVSAICLMQFAGCAANKFRGGQSSRRGHEGQAGSGDAYRRLPKTSFGTWTTASPKTPPALQARTRTFRSRHHN